MSVSVKETPDPNEYDPFQLIEAISSRDSLEEIWLDMALDLSWCRQLACLKNLKLFLWHIRENHSFDGWHPLFRTKPHRWRDYTKEEDERDMELVKTAFDTAFEASTIKQPEIYTLFFRNSDYDVCEFVCDLTFSKGRFKKDGWNQILYYLLRSDK